MVFGLEVDVGLDTVTQELRYARRRIMGLIPITE